MSVSFQLPVSQPRVNIALPDGPLPQVRRRRRGVHGLGRRQRREPDPEHLGGQRPEEVQHLLRRVLRQARSVETLAARPQLCEPVAIGLEREREARDRGRDDVCPHHQSRVVEGQERVLYRASISAAAAFCARTGRWKGTTPRC
jgi:hypothetical protein